MPLLSVFAGRPLCKAHLLEVVLLGRTLGNAVVMIKSAGFGVSQT